VDTQANRLELQIEAWGPGMEHWVLDYDPLIGSPAEPPDTPGSVWQRLDEFRRTPLLHASGRPIMISAYGIDAGGSNTQDVYNYGSARRHMNCTVLHGATRPNRPIMGSAPRRVDIEWGGQKTPGGVELWQVGTDVGKDYLFSRLHLDEGPGTFHFHDKLPAEWFSQLLAEQPRTEYVKGRTVRKWVKAPGARNEALDLSVYNLAIAHQLGLHKWSALDWQRLRDKLIPPTGDLFAPLPLPAPAVSSVPPSPPPVEKTPELANSPPTDAPSPVPSAAVQTSVQTPAAPPPATVALPPAPITHRRILSKGIR
jgi:phage terminase large subunit GpA-like protein